MQIKADKHNHWSERVRVNPTDSYSKAVIDYAIAWADLMEAELALGAKLEDIAKPTSHAADTDGITDFMYGAAVHELSQAWEHGEALRVWHNGVYGAPSAEGTINPSIINIG